MKFNPIYPEIKFEFVTMNDLLIIKANANPRVKQKQNALALIFMIN